MVLSVRYLGDPILRQKAAPVEIIDEELKAFIGQMIEAMDYYNGAGIAAPQLGRSLRIFVLRNYVTLEDDSVILSEPRVYINPKLHTPTRKQCTDTEGCLSIPGVKAPVRRPWGITVEALDIDGVPFIERIDGYNARVRMHEFDHLEGVLYTDLINIKMKKKLEPVLNAIEKKFNQQGKC